MAQRQDNSEFQRFRYRTSAQESEQGVSPPPEVLNFVEECRKFQELVAERENLYKPRIIDENASELIWHNLLGHSCFYLRNPAELHREKIQKMYDKILQYNGRVNSSGRVFFGVIYIPYYMFKSKKVNLIPIFKVYDAFHPRYYITKNGSVFETIEEFIEKTALPHSLLCMPVKGEYVLESSCGRIPLEFFNVNAYKTVPFINHAAAITTQIGISLMCGPAGWLVAFGQALGYFGTMTLITADLSEVDSDQRFYKCTKYIQDCVNSMYNSKTARMIARILLDLIHGIVLRNNSLGIDHPLIKEMVVNLNIPPTFNNIMCLIAKFLLGIPTNRTSSNRYMAANNLNFNVTQPGVQEFIACIVKIFDSFNFTYEDVSKTVKLFLGVINNNDANLLRYNLPLTPRVQSTIARQDGDYSLETFRRLANAGSNLPNECGVNIIGCTDRLFIYEVNLGISETINKIIFSNSSDFKLRRRSRGQIEIKSPDVMYILEKITSGTMVLESKGFFNEESRS